MFFRRLEAMLFIASMYVMYSLNIALTKRMDINYSLMHTYKAYIQFVSKFRHTLKYDNKTGSRNTHYIIPQ